MKQVVEVVTLPTHSEVMVEATDLTCWTSWEVCDEGKEAMSFERDELCSQQDL